MSRHRARRRALKILFSREFHDEMDIQFTETEILADDDETIVDRKSEPQAIGEEELDENAVNLSEIEDIRTEADSDEGEADTEKYCEYLVETVSLHHAELDALIRSFAKGWEPGWMNMADKTVMRVAFCEFVYPQDPLAPAIIINEAVRLAKEFGGVRSSQFVNGILGAYARTLA